MINLTDISKLAGVSKMTVSRVIHGNTNKVSEEVRQRVQSIIEETGYIPNVMARSLSQSTSAIISILIQGSGSAISDPYLSRLIGYLVDRIQDEKYFVMINTVTSYDDIAVRLSSWRSAGAIFLGTFDRYTDQVINNVTIPVVFTDTYNKSPKLNNVGTDDEKGGKLASQHFISNGHRSFAFIGWAHDYSYVVKQRLKGFRESIDEAGLEMPNNNALSVDVMPFDMATWVLALSPRPTAIFTSSDDLAIILMHQLSEKGLRIPDDISIIGFDDIPSATYMMPPLSTISQDIEEKAACVGNILFGHILKENQTPQQICLDVNLVSRGSVKNLTVD